MAKSRFLVPNHRIIDAAPIASILIMLCLPFIPPVIPLALLQVWLWLRHPRDRSRYLIALGVFGLYFATVFADFFLYCGEYQTYRRYRERGFHYRDTERLLSAAAISAATGIVPILYRLVSRCSLTLSNDDSSAPLSKSRGSIIDILFLSLFCAVTFVCLRWKSDEDSYDLLPMPQLVALAICVSAGAVMSMRLLARVWGAAIGVNFVIAWVTPLVTSLICMEAVRLVSWKMAESSGVDDYERALVGPFEWFEALHDLPATSAAFLLLPFFVLVTRRCGVILTRTDSRTVAEVEPRWFGRIHAWIGQLGVVALLTGICLAPVHLPDDGLVAGWPLNYVFLEEIPSTLSEADTEYDTIFFSVAACLTNVACVLLVTFAIFPPKWMTSRVSRWKLRSTRTVILIGFVLLMLHTCLIRPRQLRAIHRRINASNSNAEKYIGSPVPALLDALESEFSWLPETDRRRIIELQPRGLDREITELALSLPRPRKVQLTDCDVSQMAIDQLRGSPFVKELKLIECNVEGTIGSLVESLPRLESLDVSSDALPVRDLGKLRFGPRFEYLTYRVDHRGRVSIPESVKFVRIIVPNDKDQEIEIVGAAGMETLWVHNTTSDVPEAVTHLRLGRVGKLRILELDNSQQIDLQIEDAPLLTTIADNDETKLPFGGSTSDFGFGETNNPRLARLSRLALSHAPYLKLLHADFSQCRIDPANTDHRSNLGPRPGADKSARRPTINDFVFQGRQDKSLTHEGRMPAPSAAKILRGLARDFNLAAMTIRGVDVDQDLVREIGESFDLTELRFRDCAIAGDSFDNADPFPRLQVLDAESYAPDSEQFESLTNVLPQLRDIRIGGARITKLPASFAPAGRVILKGAGQLEVGSSKVIEKSLNFITFGADEHERFGLDLQGEPEPILLIHGKSAGGKMLDSLQKRLSRGEMVSRLALLSPTATKEEFQGLDWGSVEILHVIGARIDTETVNSWNLTNVQVLDLSRCDVAADVLTVLQSKPHRLQKVVLNDLPDALSPLPDLKQFTGVRALVLRGRSISESDMEKLIEANVDYIDLRRCNLSPAALEKHARHQKTGQYPGIIIGPTEVEEEYLR